MRPVRILHCLEVVYSGGVEQTRLTLAQGLDPSRFQQRMLCTEARGEMPDLLRAAGCEVIPIGRPKAKVDLSLVRSAMAQIRAFKPDIVHASVFEGMMYGVLSARLARTPALIGEEASDAIGRRWTGHQFFRWLSMRADAIVAVSPSARDYLVQQLGIPAQKVRLINNGVVERPPAGAESLLKIRERFGLTADHLVTGCVGRLVDEHKKVSDLIRALPELVAADDRVRLLIVGDGPDRAALEALAETTGVAQFVIFAGYQSRPQDFYPLMDIFAHVAAREAFGLVIAEAMFAGLPVLATRVGGIPNVVKEDETALLVAPGDISEIARQLRRLLSDAGLRKRLAGAGHARAAALFSSERYVAETERLYMDVLAQRGRTAAGRSPAG